MQNIIEILIEVSIYSSVIIVVFFAMDKFISSKTRPRVLYLLWMITLLRLLLPITIESPVNITFPVPTKADVGVEPTTQIHQPNIAEFEDELYTSSAVYTIEDTAELSPVDTQNSAPFILNIWDIIFFIWITGAVLFMTANIYKILSYKQKIGNIVSVDIRYVRLLKIAKNKLGIKQKVRVTESKYARIPFIYGYFNPIIIFPLGFFEAVDDEKLFYIIMHELSHIKRKDVLINYIWLVAKAIHWFNPFIYLAFSSYKSTVEECCDEKVIQYLDNNGRCEYSQSLIDTMRFSKKRYYIPASVSFIDSKTRIRKRVLKMMHPKKKSRAMLAFTILISCVITFSCFTTACQPLSVASSNVSLESNILTPDTNEISTENTTRPQESPSQTTVISTDNNEPLKLKHNPVGSEEAAIAIAKSFNISNSESFSYVLSYEQGIMKMHNVKSDVSDFYADYHIYDFNGEIQMLQTSALCTDEIGEEQSTDVLKQKVVDFASIIYPTCTLSITNCVKDTFTWEIEGVTHESKDYIVTGTLKDSIDNSIRTFTSKVRLDGCVRMVRAEYNGIDYLELSNEAKEKVLSYAQDETKAVDLFQVSDYYGKNLLHFSLDDRDTVITLLASDMSLIDYLRVSNGTDTEFNLSDSEVNELIQQYADYYFPENTEVIISESRIALSDYVGEGTLTDNRGQMGFYIQLSGDGKLHKIGLRSNVDKDTIAEISQEIALQTAKETVKRTCRFIDEDDLEIASQEIYEDEYIKAYSFDFKYTSQKPTIYDYSFNANVKVDVHSGDACRWSIDYIEDGLSLISQEEATEKAKEYIVNAYGVDSEKLVFKEFIVIADYILEFQVDFSHENGNSYGVSMLADTGELDGVGMGSN